VVKRRSAFDGSMGLLLDTNDVHVGVFSMTNTLKVQDVLSAPAEFAHARQVRAIAPAIVLVLELEAPLRAEFIASSESEFAALVAEIGCNPSWRELLNVYFSAKATEEGTQDPSLWEREDAHHDRLRAGRSLSTLRVSE
jgi:hypothetical protein